MKNVRILMAVVIALISTQAHAQWHVSTGTSKYVVLEESTGTWCGWNPDSHQEIMQSIIPSIPNAIVMSWHNGSTDPMTITGDPFCSGSGYITAYPQGVIDRATIGGTIAQNRPWATLVGARTSLTPNFMVEMNSSYNPSSRELSVTVTGTALATLTGNWNLNVFVLEDSISSSSSPQSSFLNTTATACNGMSCWFTGLGTPLPAANYSHMNVVRSILGSGGSIWGDAAFVNPTSGTVSSHTYTYTLPSTFNANNVFVVGVVQKYGATISDRVIENAISSKTRFMPISGTSVAADSFTVYPASNCAGMSYTINTNSYYAGMTVTTEFGDGTSASTAVTGGGSTGGYATLSHGYTTPGTYTIKHVLYNGSTVVDSVIYSFDYRMCNNIGARAYFDGNGTCAYEAGTADRLISLPSTYEIDSNGVPIDTVTCTSGFNYVAYGVPGDVYTIRLISAPTGYVIACPSTGVVTNTLGSSSTVIPINDIGFHCPTSVTGHELQVYSATRAYTNRSIANISVVNAYCTPTAATLTMHFSPKYIFSYASPAPTSVSGTEVTWNLGSLSSADPTTNLLVHLFHAPIGFLPTGDTVHTQYIVSPIVGDGDTSNNESYEVDTAIGSYDPNFVEVYPGSCMPLGATHLEYTIGFENMGGDTAHNIYVLDTIDNNLDFASLKPVFSSHDMNIFKYTSGGYNIVKFDFPKIMLPDSSHHDYCHGMLKYTINTQNITGYGTDVPARAGIYFDANPVVMTNTATNKTCFPALIDEVARNSKITVFPNPATDQLTVKAEDFMSYSEVTINNMIGQQVIQAEVSGKQTNISISGLPAGIYYVVMKNNDDQMSTTVKFSKL